MKGIRVTMRATTRVTLRVRTGLVHALGSSIDRVI